MSNYQHLLKAVVNDYVRTHGQVFEMVRATPLPPRAADDDNTARTKTNCKK